MSDATIRPIQPEDNAAMAAIIRAALTEFDAAKPGTVYFDPTTDNLHQLFREEFSEYWILESEGKVMGGAGIYPTQGLSNGYCELVKLYIAPEMRGRGFGKRLIEACVESANSVGYEFMYLETMPELSMALKLYEACGFKKLDGPLGNSGHFGCDLWMLKEL